ncbi:hypothetical protein BT69DRAFT_1335492 [Atractiella rhizophila]|nr:hypothetical protein BT69DRAFT_1335492 [Atractiella rhizophila]
MGRDHEEEDPRYPSAKGDPLNVITGFEIVASEDEDEASSTSFTLPQPLKTECNVKEKEKQILRQRGEASLGSSGLKSLEPMDPLQPTHDQPSATVDSSPVAALSTHAKKRESQPRLPSTKFAPMLASSMSDELDAAGVKKNDLDLLLWCSEGEDDDDDEQHAALKKEDEYQWATGGSQASCSSNSDCSGGEVCGTTAVNGQLARVCGALSGYWTVNQACVVDGDSDIFGCSNSVTNGAFTGTVACCSLYGDGK